MSGVPRPSISAELLAMLIDQAPSRVRRRIDKSPDAAESWQWQAGDEKMMVLAGEETVTFVANESDSNTISDPQQVQCTCLLSPKCFHVLACATRLDVQATPSDVSDDTQSNSTADAVRDEHPSDEVDQTPVGVVMRDSAVRARAALEMLLQTGARHCGVVLQSSLLRAAHQCRSTGLINLSARLLALLEGIQRLRTGSENTDTCQLQLDLADAIKLATELEHESIIPVRVLGQARRSYQSNSASRLRGLFAEPIVTLSGYAGTRVSFLADDGQTYQVSEIRPGTAELAQQVYRGGFDLGSTTASAFDLCRSSVDVQNMTSSFDGRLGRGKSTRWAIRNSDSFNLFSASDAALQPSWTQRYSMPLAEQVDRVFESFDAADGESSHGRDLIGCHGTVVGRTGASVLMQVSESGRPLRLTIALDTDEVRYRENLELLARCPGLKLSVVGRLRRFDAGSVDALMICPVRPGKPVRPGDDDGEDLPVLELPESWRGRCQLGLDRLERHYFSMTDHVEQTPFAGTNFSRPSSGIFFVRGLTEQHTALALGGRGSVPAPGSSQGRRVERELLQRNQTTAAQIHQVVSQAAHARDGGQLSDWFAASITYQTAAKNQYQRSAWQAWLG